jgi:hypothetical protein
VISYDRIPKQILQYQTKGKVKFGKTSERMELFCFVISVKGLTTELILEMMMINNLSCIFTGKLQTALLKAG